MTWEPRNGRAEIEEVDAGPRPRGRHAGGRVGRWLPVVAIAGLGVAIVGAGLLGPKPGAVPDRSPAIGAPSPASSGAPIGGSGDAEGSAAPGTPVPAVRRSGEPPDDPYLLLDGRWVNLATGIPQPGESGCELDRPFALAGGRIACVVERVTRSPGSTVAAYELGLLDLGRTRVTPAEPWASPPPAPSDRSGPPARLLTLTGRRDLVTGDPVAIAIAPGVEPDSLLLAWAVFDDDGYRVGLARFVVGDGPKAEETASREVLSVVRVDGAVPSLGDLRVSAAPGGASALVGVTFEGAGGEPAIRRLAVVPVEATSTDPARVLGSPLLLPTTVTTNAAGRAPLREGDATCGGSLGEGWADDRVLYVVCPGSPPAVRRIALAALDAGRPEATESGAPPGERPAGASWPASLVDEIELRLPPGADERSLRGNGVAVDQAAGRYYRWSPWAGTLWTVDLGAAPGSRPVADSTTLAQVTGDRAVFVPEDATAESRPLLALDAAADRVFVLDPALGDRGATVVAVRGADLSVVAMAATAPEPFATLGMSPDGALLYLATPPRVVADATSPRVAVQVLDAASLAERLFAGLLPAGTWSPGRPTIAR